MESSLVRGRVRPTRNGGVSFDRTRRPRPSENVRDPLYLGSSFLLRTQTIYVSFGISIVVVIFYGGCLAALGLFVGRNRKNKYQQGQKGVRTKD